MSGLKKRVEALEERLSMRRPPIIVRIVRMLPPGEEGPPECDYLLVGGNLGGLTPKQYLAKLGLRSGPRPGAQRKALMRAKGGNGRKQ